jgi:hypothetical protein
MRLNLVGKFPMIAGLHSTCIRSAHIIASLLWQRSWAQIAKFLELRTACTLMPHKFVLAVIAPRQPDLDESLEQVRIT